MTLESKNQHNPSTWKSQVSAFFNEKKLPTERRQFLKSTLLNLPLYLPEASTVFVRPVRTWKTPLLSSLVSAALAASATFLIIKSFPEDETPDPIAELTQLPGPKVYPPDFDLEGDSRALQDIVYELFADKDYFVSKLPAHVLAEYKPTEGRFFSWDGEPAVSIQMSKSNPSDFAKKGSDPATLFIIKLSEKSQRKFPADKITRKVAGQAGKMHKVKVWREGKFGYAMVQAVAVADTTP